MISEANSSKKLQYPDEYFNKNFPNQFFDKTNSVKRGERAREAAYFWRAL